MCTLTSLGRCSDIVAAGSLSHSAGTLLVSCSLDCYTAAGRRGWAVRGRCSTATGSSRRGSAWVASRSFVAGYSRNPDCIPSSGTIDLWTIYEWAKELTLRIILLNHT